MMKQSKRTWKIALGLGFMLSATACSKVAFTPGAATNALSSAGVGPGGGGGSGGGTSPTCSGSLATTKQMIKMIFILDMSGSNQSSPGCTLSASCTDPNKMMRAGSIQKFFDDYGNRANFSWSLETFQGTSANAITTGSNGNPDFDDATGMQSAINTFISETDVGQTPYMAALTMATNTIATDPDLNKASANPRYIVVFMSDGQPDGGADSTNNILSQVSTMLSLAPGRITFNTVYYGTGDMTAAGIIKSMATVGNGNFLNTSTNPTGLDFSISDLVDTPCP